MAVNRPAQVLFEPEATLSKRSGFTSTTCIWVAVRIFTTLPAPRSELREADEV